MEGGRWSEVGSCLSPAPGIPLDLGTVGRGTTPET